MNKVTEEMKKVIALVKNGMPTEDAIGVVWRELAEQEYINKPKKNFMSDNSLQAKLNGAKGGRPRQVKSAADLPRQAFAINSMLNKGMKNYEIAEILGIAQQSVTSAARKYGLPV